MLFSCSPKLRVDMRQISVISIINSAHVEKASIKKKSSFRTFDKQVYAFREKAVSLFNIVTDTSKIDRSIILDWVSFEGGNTAFGEIVVNDTLKYYYKSSYPYNILEKNNRPVESESIIISYLKAHRFNELESLATVKGKQLSGSNFIYIGMYEKGLDSIYVTLLPAFMMR